MCRGYQTEVGIYARFIIGSFENIRSEYVYLMNFSLISAKIIHEIDLVNPNIVCVRNIHTVYGCGQYQLVSASNNDIMGFDNIHKSAAGHACSLLRQIVGLISLEYF